MGGYYAGFVPAQRGNPLYTAIVGAVDWYGKPIPRTMDCLCRLHLIPRRP